MTPHIKQADSMSPQCRSMLWEPLKNRLPEPGTSFHTYPPPSPGDPSDTSYILFHGAEPRWLAANRTTLEIARSLDRGEAIEDAAGLLVERYGLSPDAARQDVIRVAELLTWEHFLGRKPSATASRSPTLNSVFFHLTGLCNLACLHCYLPRPGEDRHLPAELVVKLIDEVVENGGHGVTLSGGEPLLHPEIEKILEHAARRTQVRLLTNGILIDGEWAARLSDMNVTVQVSVEGSREEIHDRIRGKHSFEKVMKAIDLLQEAGLGERLHLSTTIMKQNLPDLSEIISLAERRNVALVRFLPLRRLGRGAEQWEAIGSGVAVGDHEEFYRYAWDLLTKQRRTTEISCGLSGFLLKMPDSCSADNIWCSVGRMLVVGTGGDVYPCVLLMDDEFHLGNAFREDLMSMVLSEKMADICRILSERRLRIEKCAACFWRNFCQAGCMGQALEHTGTVWDTDDFCAYRDRAYEEAFGQILGLNKVENSV